MRRSELYDKVWSTPMIRLAAELGVSDVGLAKACRRHGIPVPPRGHWAKLKAGQSPIKAPLPTPEIDMEVNLAALNPELKMRQVTQDAQTIEPHEPSHGQIDTPSPPAFAQDLSGAHPLVKSMQQYCQRLPKVIEVFKREGIRAWRNRAPEDLPPREQNGRHFLFQQGALNITASLESIDWILRFHATIFQGITDGGAVVARREGKQSRNPHQTEEPAVVMRFKGEELTIRFSEGYRRVALTAQEIAIQKREHGWANERETRPSGNFIFSVDGTEYGLSRTWQGTKEKLQDQVGDIVQTMFQLVAMQPQKRKEREQRAAVAQREAEDRARQTMRRQAQAEQLKRAFVLMETEERFRQLSALLERLENDAHKLSAPFDERLKVWIEVVKTELAAADPMNLLLNEYLAVPSWTTWPPAWWPKESPDHAA